MQIKHVNGKKCDQIYDLAKMKENLPWDMKQLNCKKLSFKWVSGSSSDSIHFNL